MTAGSPAAAPAASPAGGGARRPGLALLVIAAAQLMIVLDLTIVNTALPHIQKALGFGPGGLEWVAGAYALTFGGLLLLGGRAGDLLGRRQTFIIGVAVFAAASLAGGLAGGPAALVAARAVQGAAAAIIAPSALALVTTTFPAGPQRNRAMGVYAAMSAGGAAVGLLAGGLLVTYLSWRWVLFVNVPVGIAVALAAPRILPASPRRPGRIDLAGAIASAGGLAFLALGLGAAATGPGAAAPSLVRVLVPVAIGVVLLGAFAVIERRAALPLLPLPIMRSRERAGALAIMACTGAAMLGVFFFLTIFIQEVRGYSPLRAGVSYLPLAAAVTAAAGTSSGLAGKLGARPLLIAGTAAATGGLAWLSRIGVHSSYAGGLLGPMLVTAAGLGILFVTGPLAAMAGTGDHDAGAASSLLTASEQVGASTGLAILGAIAWTARAGHNATASHALVAGLSRGLAGGAVIMALALVITIATIPRRRGHGPASPAPGRRRAHPASGRRPA